MRNVVVQISSAAEKHEFRAKVLRITARWTETYGPASVAWGISLFAGKVETMARITCHEIQNGEDALCLWHLLRDVPGVDCGRIEDQGESWCAKSYANHLDRMRGNKLSYPDDDYAPTKLA